MAKQTIGRVHFLRALRSPPFALLWGGQTISRRGVVAFVGNMISGLALPVFGLPFPHAYEPFVATVASVFVGFGIGVLQTIWVTLLNELVPNEKQGRISSIDLLGSYCLLPIGYALAGVLTDRIGPA